MAARINNMPSYVVYDKSYNQVVSTSSTNGTLTITGTDNNIIDKDITTSFKATNTPSAPTNTLSILIDYGAELWNTQIYLKWAHAANTATISYSSNGTDWIVLNNNTDGTFNYNVLNFRYLLFYQNNLQFVNSEITIFECRVMGS